MQTWKNGEKAGVIKEIIDNNFRILDSRLSQKAYIRIFTTGDWNRGKISIPYEIHTISEPIVAVFVKDGEEYTSALGGVSVDSFYNVVLNSGAPFDGKVVIK